MLGSMPLLVRAGTKSMSLTFLHRLISTLTFAKLCHNQTKMPNGQAPLPMPEFVAFQTLSMYGVRKMAQTYVEQMCKGLSIHRRELPRLQLFASALGLFVEDLLPDESYSVVLEALGNVLHTLENDRGLTGFTNPRLFWQPYAHQHEDVWLPVSYVRPAIDAALASEPSASTREELRSAMGEFIEAHQQPNAAACAQLSAARSKNKHHRKACILGEKVPCGFVSADTVLLELSIRHASAVRPSIKIPIQPSLHHLPSPLLSSPPPRRCSTAPARCFASSRGRTKSATEKCPAWSLRCSSKSLGCRWMRRMSTSSTAAA
mmetsp:Transcript_1124/g.3414  ORF Transcript_1124/g.3414 Transcript_1124/m.3414 type:complete len:318 (-) Transcript_1124:322-1275(-)